MAPLASLPSARFSQCRSETPSQLHSASERRRSPRALPCSCQRVARAARARAVRPRRHACPRPKEPKRREKSERGGPRGRHAGRPPRGVAAVGSRPRAAAIPTRARAACPRGRRVATRGGRNCGSPRVARARQASSARSVASNATLRSKTHGTYIAIDNGPLRRCHRSRASNRRRGRSQARSRAGILLGAALPDRIGEVERLAGAIDHHLPCPGRRQLAQLAAAGRKRPPRRPRADRSSRRW